MIPIDPDVDSATVDALCNDVLDKRMSLDDILELTMVLPAFGGGSSEGGCISSGESSAVSIAETEDDSGISAVC